MGVISWATWWGLYPLWSFLHLLLKMLIFQIYPTVLAFKFFFYQGYRRKRKWVSGEGTGWGKGKTIDSGNSCRVVWWRFITFYVFPLPSRLMNLLCLPFPPSSNQKLVNEFIRVGATRSCQTGQCPFRKPHAEAVRVVQQGSHYQYIFHGRN